MSSNNSYPSASAGTWPMSNNPYNSQGQQANVPPQHTYPQPPPGQPNPFAPAPTAPHNAQGTQSKSATPGVKGTNAKDGKQEKQPFPELGRAGSWFGWVLDFISPPASSTAQTSHAQGQRITETGRDVSYGREGTTPISRRSTLPGAYTWSDSSTSQGYPQEFPSRNTAPFAGQQRTQPIDQIQQQLERFHFDLPPQQASNVNGAYQMPNSGPSNSSMGQSHHEHPQQQHYMQPPSQYAAPQPVFPPEVRVPQEQVQPPQLIQSTPSPRSDNAPTPPVLQPNPPLNYPFQHPLQHPEPPVIQAPGPSQMNPAYGPGSSNAPIPASQSNTMPILVPQVRNGHESPLGGQAYPQQHQQSPAPGPNNGVGFQPPLIPQQQNQVPQPNIPPIPLPQMGSGLRGGNGSQSPLGSQPNQQQHQPAPEPPVGSQLTPSYGPASPQEQNQTPQLNILPIPIPPPILPGPQPNREPQPHPQPQPLPLPLPPQQRQEQTNHAPAPRSQNQAQQPPTVFQFNFGGDPRAISQTPQNQPNPHTSPPILSSNAAQRGASSGMPQGNGPNASQPSASTQHHVGPQQGQTNQINPYEQWNLYGSGIPPPEIPPQGVNGAPLAPAPIQPQLGAQQGNIGPEPGMAQWGPPPANHHTPAQGHGNNMAPPNIGPGIFPPQSNNNDVGVLRPIIIPPVGNGQQLQHGNMSTNNQALNGPQNAATAQQNGPTPTANNSATPGTSSWQTPPSTYPFPSQANAPQPNQPQTPQPHAPTNEPQYRSQTAPYLPQPQVPPPATPNAAVQFQVNHLLQNPILQGLNIPPYPAPSTPTTPHPQRPRLQPPSDHHYHNILRAISGNIFNWTQIFEGDALKPLSEQDKILIKGCLDFFEFVEPGLPAALNMDVLSIEGLYIMSSHRRLLAAHIIALAVHVYIFLPLFTGLDPNVGSVLVEITNSLFTEANTINLDLKWRQAVSQHLSTIIPPQPVEAHILAQLSPVLQALYPVDLPIQWTQLRMHLHALIMLVREMKVQTDVYTPFLPTRGVQRTVDDVVMGEETGLVFVCTFPGLMRRFWDDERRGWFERLIVPAVVSLDSVLTE